jgi:hypothetical protein
MRVVTKTKRYAFAALAVVAAGAVAAPTSASAGGFYLGVDAVPLSTTLDYGLTEDYSTVHMRLKAGYEFLGFLAVEAHLYNAADDTTVDPWGDSFNFDTGRIIGIYIKPKTNFSTANVYGLFGFSQWDTTYGPVGFPQFAVTDTVTMLGLGIGGEFNLTKNLRFNAEAMIHGGTVNYSYNLPTAVGNGDLYATGIAVGLSYKF